MNPAPKCPPQKKTLKDFNILKSRDQHNWDPLRKTVFKDFFKKPKPKIETVSFVFPQQEDERVPPKVVEEPELIADHSVTFPRPAGEPKIHPLPRIPYAGSGKVMASGGRKRARARVVVDTKSPNKGLITINGRHWLNYFPFYAIRERVAQPLVATEKLNDYQITVVVKGGGFGGQSEAIRLAITNALIKLDPELRAPLKIAKYTTRDSRKKERKKPGRYAARKAHQWVKR